ncbi:hypothetical protein BKA93DRAFT_746325 [Sparassis latifolia]
MVDNIEMIVKVHSIIFQGGGCKLQIKDIYKEHIANKPNPPALMTFNSWVDHCYKYASLDGTVIFNVNFQGLLFLRLLARCVMPCDTLNQIDCRNFDLSDSFFNNFEQNCSSSMFPSQAMSPLSDLEDEQQESQICNVDDNVNKVMPIASAPFKLTGKFYTPDFTSSHYHVLNTQFDIKATVNWKVSYNKDQVEHLAWSNKERQAAKQAYITNTLEEFADAMEDQYMDGGVKQFAGNYVYMDYDIFDHKEVEVRCQDGSLLAFIAGDMPEKMKESLLCNIRTSLLGDNAPQDVHPLYLHCIDAGNTNHQQFMPYVSKELMEHQTEYENLCNSFEELFEWIQEKIHSRLPDLYEELELFAEVLPSGAMSLCHPFTSLC